LYAKKVQKAQLVSRKEKGKRGPSKGGIAEIKTNQKAKGGRLARTAHMEEVDCGSALKKKERCKKGH